ncbi:TBC1 domain family member 15 isoform X1 [Neodiprion fabricii]|uniref:TBC1 domain family member 15 isoform X1 n=1 Tax=Neodiprion fabricii TaxID=2872261 RepID=UPI001ED9402E|nr:TBC1 domain family member 15 isoform X1 [Neodiprion fabricii]
MFEPTEQGKDISIHSGVVLRGANTREDDVHSTGTLSIVEYTFGKCLEWKPTEVSVVSESQDQDPEWSLVNTHTRTRTVSEGTDSLGRSRTVRILLCDLKSFRINRSGQQLTLMLKDGTNYVVYFQLFNADSFVSSLKSFLKFIKSRKDRNMYIVMEAEDSVLEKSFAELDLFQENASDYVWKFVKNLHDRPYETTMEACSKLTDILLHKEPTRPVEEAVADLLNRSLTLDIPQPTILNVAGEEYEVIGEPGVSVVLPPRPPCPRGAPLTQEQWERCKDTDGRITNSEALKEMIFRGGISPTLRYEVWKYLLNYYPWEATNAERIELKNKKTEEYFAMKLQWKTMTPEQETRFSDFRDRKSLIEKDVNRTDRTHPYYHGDNNDHLVQLYDILMTYVMYNFDLGYVQGMSDLLSPILCLMDSEVEAFWCFVGFMNKVSTNFEMDQEGMKLQLSQLHSLVVLTDPQLAQYLDRHESGNMFFCFRWLLVLFKREFNANDILMLWEILWTDLPCKNFLLLVCVAVLDTEKNVLMENRYGFTEILKHINDLSLRIELPWTLSKAEGIYHQLMAVAGLLPDHIRVIIGLEPQLKTAIIDSEEENATAEPQLDVNDSRPRHSTGSGNVIFGNNEVSFERGINLSYM